MAEKKMGQVGITPGIVTTFTPSRSIKWAPAFNELLKKENDEKGTSRNKLIEQLIGEAVEARLTKNVTLQSDNLSPDQIALLDDFQQFISNSVKNFTLSKNRQIESTSNIIPSDNFGSEITNQDLKEKIDLDISVEKVVEKTVPRWDDFPPVDNDQKEKKISLENTPVSTEKIKGPEDALAKLRRLKG